MYENESNTEARDRGYKDGEAGKPPNAQHDYHDERSAAYIDGHRLGALIYQNDHKQDNELDIEWPIDEDDVTIKVTRQLGGTYVIKDVNSDRQLTMSWKHGTSSDQSRLLFNGKDIETEDFMGYLGLMDTVVEALGDKGVGTVLLTDEAITVLEDGES